MVEIFNKKWVYYLAENDEGKRYIRAMYSPSQLKEQLTICFTPNVIPDERYPEVRGRPFRTQEGKAIRLYSVFLSYYQFYEYLMNFVPYDHCFYEVIHGDFPQKIHFDIDIPDPLYFDVAEDIKDMVIEGCYEVMEKLSGIKLRLEHDFLVFTSHSEEKRSFHILIDNFFVKCNTECKQFYLLVMDKIPKQYRDFIDDAVYGASQNFRIVNSTKCGDYRPKKYMETFTYRGMEIKNVILDEGIRDHVLLSHSLCSFVYDCEHVPGLTQLVSRKRIVQAGELSELAVEQALDLMRRTIKEHDAFEDGKVHESIIDLKRLRSYACPICSTSEVEPHYHDSENPFIFVIGKSTYWTCRRAGNKKIYLGEIKEDDLIVDPTEEELTPVISMGLFKLPETETMKSIKSMERVEVLPVKGSVVRDDRNMFSKGKFGSGKRINIPRITNDVDEIEYVNRSKGVLNFSISK